MTAHSRRGACPGLSAPMPTGDGLLVRLRTAAPVPLAALAGICEAARRHGNGIIEISARGSVQVRGLTPQSASLFASAVAELEVVIHEGIQVIAGLDQAICRENTPVAKRMDMRVKPASDDSITSDVAAELRWAMGKARLALSPKISIVVDDGGQLHLDALPADVRLRAAGPAEGPRFTVGLGGDGATATWLGSVARKDAVGVVLGILTRIAAYGPAARAAEVLRAEGVEAFRSVSAAIVEPSSAPPRRIPAEMIGLHSARDGTVAVGIGLAFGHTHADALGEIVRVAAVHGAHTVWPMPGRALLLIGVSAPDAGDITAAAERLGFVAHAGDPRRRIAACPGAPACASGLIPSRALASVLTPILEPVWKTEHNSICVHISGCDKGCAHPMRAALTVVGTPRGCGIVHHGTARTPPGHYVDPANLGDEISRIATKTGEAAHG